jgi:REP element-mobilizing transposase RayT
MAHSFANLLYHIVFATKYRESWLNDEIRSRLWPYLGGLVKNEDGIPLIINGIADHVHLLVKLHQDSSISAFVRAIKAKSSGWIRKNFPIGDTFVWQTGYGAFTVSQSQAPRVRAYIANQEEHHRKQPFDAEFRALLRNHGFDVPEELIWD